MKNIQKGLIILAALLIIGIQLAKAETYTRDLTLGSTGNEVINLQTFLESKGYLIMPTGVAKGYFGARTKIALISYQKSINLPAFGFFGALTRKYLNDDNGGIQTGALRVTSPNGGENWKKGTTQNITWTAPQVSEKIKKSDYREPLVCPTGYSCLPVKEGTPRPVMSQFADIILQSVQTCLPPAPCATPVRYKIATSINIDTHSFQWLVGSHEPIAGVQVDSDSNIIRDGSYFIQICEVGTNTCDSSDKPFTISSSTIQPSITVTSPNGGGTWKVGETKNISWSMSGIPETAALEISLVEGETPIAIKSFTSINSVRSIEHVLSGTGCWTDYCYTLKPGKYKVSVTAYNQLPCAGVCASSNIPNASKILAQDTSDTYFIVSTSTEMTPSVTVTSPNGGEVWDLGSHHQIAWNYKSPVSDVAVDIFLTTVYTCPSSPYVYEVVCIPNQVITLDKNIPVETIYTWIVGTDIINNPIPVGTYKMKVCIAGTDKCDLSDKAFTLVTAPVQNTASPISLSASTDKMTYSQNEEIKINLTAYNSSDKDIIIAFSSGCMISYSVGLFNSMDGMACTANIPTVTLKAKSSYTWTNTHSPTRYKIPVGSQNIKVYLGAMSANPFTGKALEYSLPNPMSATVPVIITN